jgi:glutamate dehydrogenase (NAD(P)+)
VAQLIAHKNGGGSVSDFSKGRKLARDAIIDIDCDIWIPAARPDVLDASNAGRLRAKLVVEGANIPATPEAEANLHERGVLVVPDFIANAGGVICAAVEYHDGTHSLALATIEERVRANTHAVLSEAAKTSALPRTSAVALATRRVRSAMAYRRP